MLSDRNEISGPYTWNQLIYKANMREITDKAEIKEHSWNSWLPVTNYIHPGLLRDSEELALIPNRYDAMFFGGVGLFCLAAIMILISPILAIGLSIISIIIEIKSIQLGVKAHGNTKVGTFGNILAGCWIAMQMFLTALFGIIIFRGFL